MQSNSTRRLLALDRHLSQRPLWCEVERVRCIWGHDWSTTSSALTACLSLGGRARRYCMRCNLVQRIDHSNGRMAPVCCKWVDAGRLPVATVEHQPKWPSQYNWKGDYVCQRPVSLGWALVVLGVFYGAAWVVL